MYEGRYPAVGIQCNYRDNSENEKKFQGEHGYNKQIGAFNRQTNWLYENFNVVIVLNMEFSYFINGWKRAFVGVSFVLDVLRY